MTNIEIFLGIIKYNIDVYMTLAMLFEYTNLYSLVKNVKLTLRYSHVQDTFALEMFYIVNVIYTHYYISANKIYKKIYIYFSRECINSFNCKSLKKTIKIEI